MNGIHQNGKNHNFDKAHPGCLGKMVNLFELNMGVSANRLLTHKPYHDGSPLSRSRSDVSRMSPSSESTEEKVVVSEYNNSFSNRKSHVTPMKMLIAQEMSKEVNSRNDPPNLVAKLMGLDALPPQEPNATTQRSYSRVHPRSHSEIPTCYWQKQNGFFHPVDPNECQDFYGIWHQQQKLPIKERYEETTDDKQMALVRQKFVEAKRLSMDADLRQSKQFQDALEVLSSNKDLFLKCLQEPNSVFYQHLHGQQSVPTQPAPHETKRITVLKPSKVPDSNKVIGSGNKDGIQMKKAAFRQVNGVDKITGSSPPESFKYDECSAQPTRIVVLKPSPGRLQNLKAVSPQSEAQRMFHVEDFLGDVEDDENKRSREVAKAITQQMREKLGRHRRDETLISSVYSNASVGNESSFNISEIEYNDGNLSDSEGMSPVSRHSWDCGNRLGSPYSSSPFSRASYSPDSSVCREAKRRLSERWAMMSSNGCRQEPKHVRRNSSTLGEMLALSEANTPSPAGEDRSVVEPKDFDSELRHDDNVDISPRSLMRSKSVPVSCTEFGMTPNIVICVPNEAKAVAPCEDAKAKCIKTSFKGKVSNLFFSRNRKRDEDKPLETEANNHHQSLPGEIYNDRTETLGNEVPKHSSPGLEESSIKSLYSSLVDKQHLAPAETSLVVAKPFAPGKQGENQDQPSPISVLDQPFVEDEGAANVFPHFAKSIELPHDSIGSNLIDKSPPIGSIARTLSWNDSCIDTASSYLADETLNIQGTGEDKLEWYSFIKTLLSVAGFHDDVQSKSFFARWHSPECPLDPSLRDKYIEDKEALHEAKRRQKRSTQKLVFDCVNAALMEIVGYRAFSGHQIIPYIGVNNCILESGLSTLVDEVWARMQVLFSDKVRCLSDDCGDDTSLVVERVVRKEVAGKGWIDHLRLEMDSLGNEIEGNLLAELVHEAVVDLTGRV